MDQERINFLYDSIHDIQSTIRAIDTKIAALLVILGIPLTNIGKIIGHISKFYSNAATWFFWFILILFILSWLLSLITIILAISAIDNPVKYVKESDSGRGLYYGANLYTIGLFNPFWGRAEIRVNSCHISL